MPLQKIYTKVYLKMYSREDGPTDFNPLPPVSRGTRFSQRDFHKRGLGHLTFVLYALGIVDRLLEPLNSTSFVLTPPNEMTTYYIIRDESCRRSY